MGRPKAKPKTEDETPKQKALESQPPDSPNPAPPTSVSKAEAVRAALAEGRELPGDIADFVKTRYGIDMTKPMVSSYKTQEKARDAKQAGTAPQAKAAKTPKAAPSQAVEGYLAPPPKPQAVGDQPDLLAALEAMKPLVASLGVEKVKRIAELLG